jgi:hypothetical protein
MDNNFGIIAAIVAAAYCAFAGSFLPAAVLVRYLDHRECAQTHNVFRCEMSVVWTPVVEATP